MRLLIVHGFLGSSRNWVLVKNRLEKGPLGKSLEILLVDLLWHAKRPGPTDIRENLEDLLFEDFKKQVNEKWPSENFIALGHSYGLRPILANSLSFKDRIQALIAEDSSPELSEPGAKLLGGILRDLPESFEDRTEAKKILDSKFGKETPMSRFLYSNLEDFDLGKLRWRFNRKALSSLLSECPNKNFWKEWSSFKNPILWMLGDKDSYVSTDKLEKGKLLRADHPLIIEKIPNSGHWVHADNLEGFASSLENFLLNQQNR